MKLKILINEILINVIITQESSLINEHFSLIRSKKQWFSWRDRVIVVENSVCLLVGWFEDGFVPLGLRVSVQDFSGFDGQNLNIFAV